MPAKPVLFISDLHLGAGPANDFHQTYQLHRFLDYAREEASELVILGDFLELLQCELTEIYVQHHQLLMHLFDLSRQIPVKYVIGNHDALVAIDYRSDAPSYFLGSPILVTPEYENRTLKIFAAHGHQHSLLSHRDDILDLSEGSTPGDRIAHAAGWLERHVHPKLDDFLVKTYLDYKILLRKIHLQTKSYAELVTPAHSDYERLGGDYGEYEKGALDVLRSDRYSLCLFGHTHRQQIQRFTRDQDGADGLYANTGSWVENDAVKYPPTFAEVSVDRVRLVDAETYEVLDSAERNLKRKTYNSGKKNTPKRKRAIVKA